MRTRDIEEHTEQRENLRRLAHEHIVHQHVEHHQNDVGDRPGDALEHRGKLPADVAHETELIELAAQREKHREPKKGRQGAPLQVDVLERQDVGREEHAQAGEGHRREAQMQRCPP